MLIIRLKKIMKHKRILFYLVVTKYNSAPTGGYLEKVGTYSPQLDKWSNRYLLLKRDRVLYWLARGVSVKHMLTFSLMEPLLNLGE